MPDRQYTIHLGFTADINQAKQQMNQLQAQLEKLSTTTISADGLKRGITEANNEVIKLSTILKDSFNVDTGKLDLNKFLVSTKQYGMSLESIKKTLESLEGTGGQAWQQLNAQIAQGQTGIVQMTEKLQAFAKQMKRTISIQLSYGIMNTFLDTFRDAYSYAQKLNKSLNNIQIVTGKSISEMRTFAVEANKAAKALSTSTTAYTDAALIYYQQGLNNEQVKERTDTTIKLANVTGQSAEEVSSYMTAIWNNFDDGSKKLEYYADVITALGAATASSSEEIAEGLSQFSAVADTVGLSYEYATAALATVVAQTRQSADTVGNAFKTIFARLESLNLGETLEDDTTLTKYTAALEKVGITVKLENGQLKNMDNILDELGSKWESINSQQKNALAYTVAGARQYTNFIALMDNWGKVQENIGIASGAEGTLQNQADIYAKSWEAANKRLKASWQELYDLMINDDFFISLANGISSVVEGVSKLVKSFGGLKGILPIIVSLFSQIASKQLTQSIFSTGTMIQSIGMSLSGKDAKAKKDAAKQVSLNNSNTDMGAGGISLAGIKDKHVENLNTLIEKSSKYNELEKEMLQRIINRDNALIKLGEDANNVYADEEQDIGHIVSSYKKLEQAQSDIAVLEKTLHEQGQIYLSDIKGLSETTRQELLKFTNGNIDGKISKKNIREILYKKDGLKNKENVFNKQVNQQVNDYLQKISINAEQAQQKINDCEKDIIEANEKIEQLGKGLTKGRKKELELIEKGSVAYKQLNDQEKEYIDTIDYAANCQEELNQAKEKSAECNRILAQTEEQTRKELEKTANEMNAAAQKIQQFISLSTGIIALGTAIDQFGKDAKEGNLSLSNFISIAMGATTVTSGLFSTFDGLAGGAKDLATAIGFKGAAASIAGFVGVAGAAIAVVLGLVLAFKGISALVKAQHLKTLDGQIETLQKTTEDAATAADEARNRYQSVIDTLDGLDSALDKIHDLKKGTIEWTQAVADNNQQIIHLLSNYGKLNKDNYYIDNDGVYHLGNKNDPESGEKLERELIGIASSNYNRAMATSYASQAQLEELNNQKNFRDNKANTKERVTVIIDRKDDPYDIGPVDSGVNNKSNSVDVTDSVVKDLAKWMRENNKSTLEEKDILEAIKSGNTTKTFGLDANDIAKQISVGSELTEAAEKLYNAQLKGIAAIESLREAQLQSLYGDEVTEAGYNQSLLSDEGFSNFYKEQLEQKKSEVKIDENTVRDYMMGTYGILNPEFIKENSDGSYSVSAGGKTYDLSEDFLKTEAATKELDGHLTDLITLYKEKIDNDDDNSYGSKEFEEQYKLKDFKDNAKENTEDLYNHLEQQDKEYTDLLKQHLIEINSLLAEDEDLANRLAVNAQAEIAALTDLMDNGTDYFEAFNSAVSGQHVEALQKIQKDLGQIFGQENYIELFDEDFINTNQKLIKQLFNGTKAEAEAAFTDISNMILQKMLLTMGYTEEEALALINNIDTITGTILTNNLTTGDLLWEYLSEKQQESLIQLITDMMIAGKTENEIIDALDAKNITIPVKFFEQWYDENGQLKSGLSDKDIESIKTDVGKRIKDNLYVESGITKSFDAAKTTSKNSNKNKDKDKETDRYYTISRQVEKLNKQLDELGKKTDRAFGQSKLDAIQAEIDKYNDLISANKEYLRQAEEWLENDRAKLEQYGAQFDANGIITNYEAMFAAHGNDEDGEWAKWLSHYEDSLAKVQELQETIAETQRNIYDKALESIEYKLEFSIKINDSELKYLEYILDGLEDAAYDSAEAIATLEKKIDNANKKAKALNQNATELFDIVSPGNGQKYYEQMLAGILDLQALANEKILNDPNFNAAQWFDDINKLYEELIQNQEDYRQMWKDYIDMMKNFWDSWKENFDKQKKQITDLTKVAEFYKDLVGILGKDELGLSDATMARLDATVSKGRLDEALISYKTFLKAQKALQEAEEKDLDNEVIEYYKEKVQEAKDELMSAQKAAAQAFVDEYNNALDRIVKNAMDAFSNIGDFDWMKKMYDLELKRNDLYMDTYEKAYQMNKLNNDITRSINEIDSLKTKQELSSLLDEINAKQASGVKMSEYEYEAYRKEYELLLAIQALEDAKNAKNQVRMSRDSEGNMSYVYTADQDAIDTATDNYNDIAYQFAQLNMGQAANAEAQYLALYEQMMTEIREVGEEHRAEIEEKYAEMLKYWKDQAEVSYKWNKSLMDQMGLDYWDLTVKFEDSVLAHVTGCKTWEELEINRKETTKQALKEMADADQEYHDKVHDLLEETGLDVDDFEEQVNEDLDDINDGMDETMDATEDLADEFDDALDDMMDEAESFEDKWDSTVKGVIAANDALIKSLGALIQQYNNLALAKSKATRTSYSGPVGSGSGSSSDTNSNDSSTTNKTPDNDKKYKVRNDAGDIVESGLSKSKAQAIADAHNKKVKENPKYYGGDGSYYWVSMKTGGYTGEWGPEGRLAMLHQKELVLNSDDTANMFQIIDAVRDVTNALELQSHGANVDLSGTAAGVMAGFMNFDQNVHITAEFPNATDRNEIQAAFADLMNRASQYINRK